MMVSDCNESAEETLEEIGYSDDIRASKPHGYIQISIPSDEARSPDPRRGKMQILAFLKDSVLSVSSSFWRTVDEREEISASTPSRPSIRQHFDTHFIKRLNLPSLVRIFREWIKHPMNAAFLIWLMCVAAFAVMLGLLLLGFLNKAYPTKSLRNRWIEINNQVLNALFTLMSLYQHPSLFHHMVLLCRWRSEDVIELRKVYCKNGGYRPREWAHMTLVVLLLHVTCFAQYVSCGLYWTYSKKLRPPFAENFSFALGTVAPMVAGLYTVYSPLGREFGSDTEEELQDAKLYKSAMVSKPEWNGGLFDCSNDRTAGFLSCCCTFCVFGWNMERLGFGNMYVHMVTFFLLCVAPFWIFSISALNISNDAIRDVVGVSGMVVSVFGLLYGGFWRIKMREKFGLPGNSLCCGSESMTDYLQWMFCWSCSLAQEVRTVNLYDVEVDSDEERCTFLEMDGDCDAQYDGVLVEKRVDSNFVTRPPIQPSISVQSECTVVEGDLETKPPCCSERERTMSDCNRNVESKSDEEAM